MVSTRQDAERVGNSPARQVLAPRLSVLKARRSLTTTVERLDRMLAGGGAFRLLLARKLNDRVFDRFYTTKPGRLGIGLSICRSIVEAHGGRLWATAGVAHGASFNFTLPAGARFTTHSWCVSTGAEGEDAESSLSGASVAWRSTSRLTRKCADRWGPPRAAAPPSCTKVNAPPEP
jgi:hypothetical protein